MDLSKLTQDGDTLDLEDGRKLRLRIEPDQDYDPFEDTDVFGKRAALNAGSHNLTGERERPEGFDGNAEKLLDYQGYGFWWQPPQDVKRGDPQFTAVRDEAMEAATYGGYILYLELLKGEDAYRRPIVTKVAEVYGVDFASLTDIKEFVVELWGELQAQGDA